MDLDTHELLLYEFLSKFVIMFIRSNLLHVHHRYHHNYQQWSEKFLKSCTSALNTFVWRRHCCDIKRNEELLLSAHGGSGVIIPTPLKIKQTIKIGGHDFVDGFTCIQTSCLVCPKDSTTATSIAASAIDSDSTIEDKAQMSTDKCLFINKTTGNLHFICYLPKCLWKLIECFLFLLFSFGFCFSGDVVCSKCQHTFSFSAIENFFTKTPRSTDNLNRSRDLFMRSKPKPTILTGEMIDKNAIPVQEMAHDALLEVIQNLGIQKIEPNILQKVQAFCHAKQNTLYFPLIDIQSNMVGYKKLTQIDKHLPMTETTSPEENSYGAVIFSPTVKRGFRDQKTAIIVLNVLDALALRTETNCEYDHSRLSSLLNCILCKMKEKKK